MMIKVLGCLSGPSKHSYVSQHETSPNSAYTVVLPQLTVHVTNRMMQPYKHSERWNGRKTDVCFVRIGLGPCLQHAQNAFSLNFGRLPYFGDPGAREIALQTAVAWKQFLAQVDGMPRDPGGLAFLRQHRQQWVPPLQGECRW